MINSKKNGFSLRQGITAFVALVFVGVIFYSALFTAGTVQTRVLWSPYLVYGLALAFSGILVVSMFVRLVIPGLRGLSYFVTYGIVLFGIVGAAILMSKNDSTKNQESDQYLMQKRKVDSFLKAAEQNDSLAAAMLAVGQKGNARYYKNLANQNRKDYKDASAKFEVVGVSAAHADNSFFAGLSDSFNISDLWFPVLMGVLLSAVIDHSALLLLAVLMLLSGLLTWARNEHGEIGLYPTQLCEKIFPFSKLAGDIQEIGVTVASVGQDTKKKSTPAQRREWIKKMIGSGSIITPEDLEAEFGVSLATAYNDLKPFKKDDKQFGFN